jgi:hypothetical protein
MYFKTMVKKVTNEIIKQEKELSYQNDWSLYFDWETMENYKELILTCTKASNFNKWFDVDRERVEEGNEGAEEELLHFWFISEYILSEIEWLGYNVK